MQVPGLTEHESSYYSDRLSAEGLRRCYDLAPPEVVAYLDAEVRYIRSSIATGARVLELGCGYRPFLAMTSAVSSSRTR